MGALSARLNDLGGIAITEVALAQGLAGWIA